MLRPILIRPRWHDFRSRACGRRIAAVARAGKRVVLVLDDDARIVIEPRMTGRVLLDLPLDATHVRLVFELASVRQQRLAFLDTRGLGVVRLLSGRQYAEQLGPAKLGPDALQITGGELVQRLSASRRAIKVALLDQRVVAGIGNIYASEMLHRAGIHPARACTDLDAGDWTRLHAALREVLLEAIRFEGSTLRDGAYRNARSQAGSFQNLHRVYQREGMACLQCVGGQIARLIQAQRSTFFCPACQPGRRP